MSSKSKKSPSEASIVKACMAAFVAAGGHIIKTAPPGVPAGTPDLLGVLHGQCYAIEVKRPGKRPAKLQEYRLAQWRAAGAVAVWVDSVEALLDLIQHPIYGVDNREPTS